MRQTKPRQHVKQSKPCHRHSPSTGSLAFEGAPAPEGSGPPDWPIAREHWDVSYLCHPRAGPVSEWRMVYMSFTRNLKGFMKCHPANPVFKASELMMTVGAVITHYKSLGSTVFQHVIPALMKSFKSNITTIKGYWTNCLNSTNNSKIILNAGVQFLHSHLNICKTHNHIFWDV